MKKKVAFVVHPGFVRSQNDGDQHYISANELARLYMLEPGTWTVYQPPRAFDRAANWRRDPYEGMKAIFPRSDGKYPIFGGEDECSAVREGA
jgi:hypothetical protein